MMCVDIYNEFNVPLKASEKYLKLEHVKSQEQFEPLIPIIDEYLFKHHGTRQFMEWIEIHKTLNTHVNPHESFIEEDLFKTLCWINELSETQYATKTEVEKFKNILVIWKPSDEKMENRRSVLIYRIDKILDDFQSATSDVSA